MHAALVAACVVFEVSITEYMYTKFSIDYPDI
jgi:hypothetical protein